MDRAAAEDWIRAQVDPVGPIEMAHDRPWATVLRVPLANGIASEARLECLHRRACLEPGGPVGERRT